VSAAGLGFGRGLWRCGFDVLALAGAIVVDEFEFCAETTNPVLAKAPKMATATARTK
jgi:hypothetical protein